MAKASDYLRTSRVKRRIVTVLLWVPVLLVLLRLLFSLSQDVPDTAGKLLVDVLDVGQSDAVLLRTEDEVVLIDSGTAAAGESLILELRRLGVEGIDCLVLTHPHEDHYGNARRLLTEFEVSSLLIPASDRGDAGYDMVLTAASQKGILTVTAQTGQVLPLGNASLTVLSAAGEDTNNDSIVLRVVYGDTALLLMGDAEAETEQALLSRYEPADLDCDFLKVGHHGSKTATTADFVAAVTPAVAAVSCGTDNEYGFPHVEVLQNLQAAGAAVYRTDLSGTLSFETDGTAFTTRKD